ncbi:hypothetical protein MKX03_008419, partial [Papaver bracteatum]
NGELANRDPIRHPDPVACEVNCTIQVSQWEALHKEDENDSEEDNEEEDDDDCTGDDGVSLGDKEEDPENEKKKSKSM